MTLEGSQYATCCGGVAEHLCLKGVFARMEMENAVLDKESPIPTIDGDINVDRSITSPLGSFGSNDGRIQVR